MSRNKLQLFPAFPGKHLIIHHHIQFPAKQYAVHAEIHPQHDEHDSGKASIHIGKPFEYIYVYRKYPGYDHPSNGRKYRPWQLLAQLVLPVWQEFINQEAEDHQYNGGDDGTHSNQSVRQILKNRYMRRNEYIQRIAKYG